VCSVNTFAELRPSLHVIFLGVGGTIYSPLSLEHLKHLSLNPEEATKVAVKLYAHTVQYAYKLSSTRRAREKHFAANHHQDQKWGSASPPPYPH